MTESNSENKLNENKAIEDIEFDDNIDIDELQAKLQQHMSNEGVDYNTTAPDVEVLDGSNAVVPSEGEALDLENFVQSVSNDNVKEESEPEKAKEDEKLKLQLGEKKYIIYIEPDNIDFIDGLTIKARKKVINRL